VFAIALVKFRSALFVFHPVTCQELIEAPPATKGGIWMLSLVALRPTAATGNPWLAEVSLGGMSHETTFVPAKVEKICPQENAEKIRTNPTTGLVINES
jgi:hypothetical protein